MELLQTYAQHIGIAAGFLMILRYQFASATALKLTTTVGAFLFMWHYIGLGEIPAAILCVIAAVRSAILATAWGMTHRNVVGSVIVAASVISGGIFWSGIVSALPVVAISLYTLAEMQTCTKRLRFIAFMPPSVWLVFNIITGSYGGMMSNIAGLTSNIIGLYRHHFRKQAL